VELHWGRPRGSLDVVLAGAWNQVDGPEGLGTDGTKGQQQPGTAADRQQKDDKAEISARQFAKGEHDPLAPVFRSSGRGGHGRGRRSVRVGGTGVQSLFGLTLLGDGADGVVDGAAEGGDGTQPQPQGFAAGGGDAEAEARKKRRMNRPVDKIIEAATIFGGLVFGPRHFAVAIVEHVTGDQQGAGDNIHLPRTVSHAPGRAEADQQGQIGDLVGGHGQAQQQRCDPGRKVADQGK